ncbi:MAG TPA: hypothetical protein DDW65_10510 [Firmicutes bacterium]|jgi:hypothetical protein|nr:hypothetical protein [Bacillota bacterium]
MDDNKVAVLLEDLRAQFRTFGEGLQLLNDKVDKGFQEVKTEIDSLKLEVTNLKADNRQEHQQLKQMVKELDTEVVQIKRIK